MLSVVDLYSGCGGLSRGFTDAGFNVQLALDFWKPAVDNYRFLVGEHIQQHDLSDTAATIEKIKALAIAPDLIIGGPPCQDFSSAGNRSEGDRADHTIRFADVVCAIQPQVFVMENVTLARKSNAFKTSVEKLRGCGFTVLPISLNAARYDVPQRRRRLFTIGALDSTVPVEVERYLSRIAAPKDKTVREENISTIEADGIEFYYRHPRSYERRGVFSIDEPSPTVRGVNRPVPAFYREHKNDKHVNKVDISKVRKLTYQERALLQTFPPDHFWQGNTTDIEQMIGNAVPVRLAQAVAFAVKHSMG